MPSSESLSDSVGKHQTKVRPMEPEEKPGRKHTVVWDPDDWQRIEEAARVKGEQEHMDLAPVDIIRSGTRRLVEEIIGTPASR